jgi:hypothetical protein
MAGCLQHSIGQQQQQQQQQQQKLAKATAAVLEEVAASLLMFSMHVWPAACSTALANSSSTSGSSSWPLSRGFPSPFTSLAEGIAKNKHALISRLLYEQNM